MARMSFNQRKFYETLYFSFYAKLKHRIFIYFSREEEKKAKERQETQSVLSSLVDSLKNMIEKCLSNEFNEIFDVSFVDSLRNSLEGLEILCTNSNNLNQVEKKYTEIEQDFRQKVENQIQKHYDEKKQRH